MKVLVAGSRSINEFDISKYIPSDTELIICGGAKGIDTLVENYADKMRISKLVLRPQYSKYKRAAPLKRNEEMIKIADYVLVIWDGKSKGTEYTINYAKNLDKEINVIIID